jgi:hypothetical protein
VGRHISVGMIRYGMDGPGVRIPVKLGDIFRTRSDRICGPFSLLYNGHRVSLHFKTKFLTSTITVPYKQNAIISERLNVHVGPMIAIV